MQDVLVKAGLLRANAPVASALTQRLELVDVARGHAVCVEGDPGSRLYIIVSGKVKIGHRLPSGRESLLTILGPSEVFGELSMFDPGPRVSTATAITEVRAAWMDRATLTAWTAQHPEIAEQLLRVIARRLRRTDESMTDLLLTDTSARLAKRLLQLAQKFGVPYGDVLWLTHDLTQDELAQLIGSTRETVNKSLSDFVSRGWIETHGKSVIIKDSEGLAWRTRTHLPESGRAA